MAKKRGEPSTLVSHAGARTASEHTSTVMTWEAQPRYAEGRDVFVLLSSDKNATSFTMLPKRALRTPAEVDQLRSLLDQHAARG
ncbi:YcxB family protein [Streptomyces sp. NBC_00344]